MKMIINVNGRDHTVRVPLSLALSLVAVKNRETGKTVRINRAARKKLRSVIRETKKKYSDMPIVEMKDKKGEGITIRL